MAAALSTSRKYRPEVFDVSPLYLGALSYRTPARVASAEIVPNRRDRCQTSGGDSKPRRQGLLLLHRTNLETIELLHLWETRQQADSSGQACSLQYLH